DLIAPRRRGADLRYILSDLVQVGKMEESVALATAIQRGLVGHLGTRYPDVADLGVKRGPFYVLVGAYMPCVLVETSFLTHPTEGRRLAARSYREAVAEGIYAGVARFLADGRRARTL
ncbi:MAG TPA: N-acetylmuramoyl-L-alanine amidase, partial [Candidatus Binatia bacterium]|nr:N-acetylmuramoyl-L-alanine amidase [Candidatus Binatia bacterium]